MSTKRMCHLAVHLARASLRGRLCAGLPTRRSLLPLCIPEVTYGHIGGSLVRPWWFRTMSYSTDPVKQRIFYSQSDMDQGVFEESSIYVSQNAMLEDSSITNKLINVENRKPLVGSKKCKVLVESLVDLVQDNHNRGIAVGQALHEKNLLVSRSSGKVMFSNPPSRCPLTEMCRRRDWNLTAAVLWRLLNIALGENAEEMLPSDFADLLGKMGAPCPNAVLIVNHSFFFDDLARALFRVIVDMRLRKEFNQSEGQIDKDTILELLGSFPNLDPEDPNYWNTIASKHKFLKAVCRASPAFKRWKKSLRQNCENAHATEEAAREESPQSFETIEATAEESAQSCDATEEATTAEATVEKQKIVNGRLFVALNRDAIIHFPESSKKIKALKKDIFLENVAQVLHVEFPEFEYRTQDLFFRVNWWHLLSVEKLLSKTIRVQTKYFGKSNPAVGGCNSHPRVPVAQHTFAEENNRMKYAVSSMKLQHSQTEDYHANILDLGDRNSTSFFGVFDGHGGCHIASYCAKYFSVYLRDQDDFDNNLVAAIENVCNGTDLANLRLTLITIDEELQTPIPCPPGQHLKTISRAKLLHQKLNVGSTACIALIRGNQIIVGNVGDSHCILSRNGQAIDLGNYHTPDLETESKRIVAAGGTLISGYHIVRGKRAVRIDGVLATSRAFGDFGFKSDNNLNRDQQMMICDPEICTEIITDDTEFLFIASDGVWNVMESQEVVDFIHKELGSQARRGATTDVGAICQSLVASCVFSGHDVTAILVQFKAPLPPPLSVQPTSSNASPQTPGHEIEEASDRPQH